jgi:hypothetical protein
MRRNLALGPQDGTEVASWGDGPRLDGPKVEGPGSVGATADVHARRAGDLRWGDLCSGDPPSAADRPRVDVRLRVVDRTERRDRGIEGTARRRAGAVGGRGRPPADALVDARPGDRAPDRLPGARDGRRGAGSLETDRDLPVARSPCGPPHARCHPAGGRHDDGGDPSGRHDRGSTIPPALAIRTPRGRGRDLRGRRPIPVEASHRWVHPLPVAPDGRHRAARRDRPGGHGRRASDRPCSDRRGLGRDGTRRRRRRPERSRVRGDPSTLARHRSVAFASRGRRRQQGPSWGGPVGVDRHARVDRHPRTERPRRADPSPSVASRPGADRGPFAGARAQPRTGSVRRQR